MKYVCEGLETPAFAVQTNVLQSFESQSKSSMIALEVVKPSAALEKMTATDFSISLKPNLQISQLERPQSDPDPGAIFQVHSSVKTYNPERKDVSDVKPLLTDMVIIPEEASTAVAKMVVGTKCQGIK